VLLLWAGTLIRFRLLYRVRSRPVIQIAFAKWETFLESMGLSRISPAPPKGVSRGHSFFTFFIYLDCDSILLSSCITTMCCLRDCGT
jgi:hypothetical protein